MRRILLSLIAVCLACPSTVTHAESLRICSFNIQFLVDRYVGIDYSGAGTPTQRTRGLCRSTRRPEPMNRVGSSHRLLL